MRHPRRRRGTKEIVMVGITTEIAGIGGAALASVLFVLVGITVRHRRRVARHHQAEQQAAYDATVTGFRGAVSVGQLRRAQLVELLEVAFAGRTDRAITTAGSAGVDASVSRLYLDLALAGDDHGRRETILRVVRRGISDIEMLMPEVPLPPAPVARLSRRARRRAQQWHAARAAELDSLRALLEDPAIERAAAVPVPKQKVATAQPVGTALAIAS
jgi:hypothetical protein